MPIYEYLCQHCSHRFEVKQSIKDDPLSSCIRCGQSVTKLISSPAIMFKGSGWYITDYSDKLKPTGGTEGGDKPADKPADKGADGKAAQPAAAGTDGKAASSPPAAKEAPASAGSTAAAGASTSTTPASSSTP